MWASPFEIMLANLKGQVPEPGYRTTSSRAYEELKKISGHDFGWDVLKWEEWGFDNNMFMNPPRYLELLRNFEQRVSSRSLYFMPREKAYEGLKSFTGEDFGDDVQRWRKWGIEHGHLREP